MAKACQLLGVSRDTFYCYKRVVEEAGIETLLDVNRKKPNLKNRIDPEVETAVVKCAVDFPVLCKVHVSNELRKAGVFVS